MQKLAVLDVDGVLLDCDIGGFKQLARMIGKEKEVLEHEAEYQRRKHLGPWGLDELAMMFKGVPEQVLRNHAKAILQQHIRPEAYQVVAAARQCGYLVAAYSSEPSWIMDELQEMLKLDDSCANVIETDTGGIVTGKRLVSMDRYGKEKRLVWFQEQEGISPDSTVVFGDSVTDLPMASHGNFYAFNCKDETVRSKALASIEPPLTNVLKYLR